MIEQQVEIETADGLMPTNEIAASVRDEGRIVPSSGQNL